MKIINSYMKYVYILLIGALVIVLITFIRSLVRTIRNISDTAQGAGDIGTQLNLANEKVTAIKESSDSYKFFLSAFAVFIIIKEAFKYSKSEKSFTKSFAKAFMRHSSSIGKIRL